MKITPPAHMERMNRRCGVPLSPGNGNAQHAGDTHSGSKGGQKAAEVAQ